jgi:hypothetical protein
MKQVVAIDGKLRNLADKPTSLVLTGPSLSLSTLFLKSFATSPAVFFPLLYASM